MVPLDEEAHGTCVVQSRCEHEKEVVDETGMVVQVELEGLVVKLSVGGFGDNVLEDILLPGLCRVGHHGLDCVVKFLIFVIEEDQL